MGLMAKRPTVVKHVRLSADTHRRLRVKQADWEVKTIDLTIQRLLDSHHDDTPLTTDAGTKMYPNEKGNTTQKRKKEISRGG